MVGTHPKINPNKLVATVEAYNSIVSSPISVDGAEEQGLKRVVRR